MLEHNGFREGPIIESNENIFGTPVKTLFLETIKN